MQDHNSSVTTTRLEPVSFPEAVALKVYSAVYHNKAYIKLKALIPCIDKGPPNQSLGQRTSYSVNYLSLTIFFTKGSCNWQDFAQLKGKHAGMMLSVVFAFLTDLT